MKAYVINLPDRKDRWDAFQKHWEGKGLELVRVDGIRMDDAYQSVFLKHRELLEQAKARGEKHMLVMEDDAIPYPDFKKRFKHIRDYVDIRDDWDVMNGGMLSIRDCVHKIVRIEDDNLATMLLGVSRGCMAQFLYFKVDTALAKIADWEAEGKPEFDAWYAYKLDCLACVPFLAIQSDGVSDVTKEKREWEERFKMEQMSMMFALREFL